MTYIPEKIGTTVLQETTPEEIRRHYENTDDSAAAIFARTFTVLTTNLDWDLIREPPVFDNQGFNTTNVNQGEVNIGNMVVTSTSEFEQSYIDLFGQAVHYKDNEQEDEDIKNTIVERNLTIAEMIKIIRESGYLRIPDIKIQGPLIITTIQKYLATINNKGKNLYNKEVPNDDIADLETLILLINSAMGHNEIGPTDGLIRRLDPTGELGLVTNNVSTQNNIVTNKTESPGIESVQAVEKPSMAYTGYEPNV